MVIHTKGRPPCMHLPQESGELLDPPMFAALLDRGRTVLPFNHATAPWVRSLVPEGRFRVWAPVRTGGDDAPPRLFQAWADLSVLSVCVHQGLNASRGCPHGHGLVQLWWVELIFAMRQAALAGKSAEGLPSAQSRGPQTGRWTWCEVALVATGREPVPLPEQAKPNALERALAERARHYEELDEEVARLGNRRSSDEDERRLLAKIAVFELKRDLTLVRGEDTADLSLTDEEVEVEFAAREAASDHIYQHARERANAKRR